MKNNYNMKNTLWIARDENERLYLFNDRPIKVNFEGQQIFAPNGYCKDFPIDHESLPCFIMKIDWNLFPELTFNNSPQQIELTLVNNNENINTLWIARNENESLYLYNYRPINLEFEGQKKFMPNRYKDSFFECINPEPIIHFILKIDSKLFPEVTWENSPQQVKLTLVNNSEK